MNAVDHLCMIFEAIGPYNAIGKGAAGNVRIALEAGYRVTVVAKQLDESFRGEVEWRKLTVPPRGFAAQWLTGRHFIRKALGDPRRFDVIHGHQPQIADLCDVFQCHFLTRVAWERGCLYDRTGWRRALDAAQKRVVLHAEDHFYSRWNPHTRMLFNSGLTRREFARLYGMPPREQVLVKACSPWDPPTEAERARARGELVGEDETRPVVGFLGGLHERKGYRRMIAALEKEPEADLLLLMGGLHSEGFNPPGLGGRFQSVGLVRDTAAFYAACDVVIVPSLFEPLGMVAFEAAARGVPVIATEEVGALPHVLDAGAGASWNPAQLLGPVAGAIVGDRERYRAGCRRLCEAHSQAAYRDQLLAVWRGVLESKGDRAEQPAPAAVETAAHG